MSKIWKCDKCRNTAEVTRGLSKPEDWQTISVNTYGTHPMQTYDICSNCAEKIGLTNKTAPSIERRLLDIIYEIAQEAAEEVGGA